MSETLSPLLVALVLLAAYRFWRRPGWRTGAWLGASIGIAALARDELTLLGLFIVVPLALTARATWRQRVGWLAAAAVVAVVIVGPWVGYNMSRFKDPVFISSGLGITLASANCGYTYHGEFEGYWDFECANSTPINPNVDESVQGAEAQHYAVQYIKSHFGHFIPVEFARFGRAFGLYHPMGQIRFDSVIETRPYHWALLGLIMYYGLLAGSVGGIVVMRRRKVPVYPMLAVGATVVISTLLTFGNTRYRSTFEVSLVLMTAVALGFVWDRARPGRPADGKETAAGGDRDLDPPRPSGGEPSMAGPVPSA
jgi:4-amino-4-deoxy-L-arabinose transferase-like glycosyltransferase